MAIALDESLVGRRDRVLPISGILNKGIEMNFQVAILK